MGGQGAHVHDSISGHRTEENVLSSLCGHLRPSNPVLVSGETVHVTQRKSKRRARTMSRLRRTADFSEFRCESMCWSYKAATFCPIGTLGSPLQGDLYQVAYIFGFQHLRVL